jgi:hypothetical protein
VSKPSKRNARQRVVVDRARVCEEPPYSHEMMTRALARITRKREREDVETLRAQYLHIMFNAIARHAYERNNAELDTEREVVVCATDLAGAPQSVGI